MNKNTYENIVKNFPILNKDNFITVKAEKEFEEDLEITAINFTLPDFLKDYDWLPEYKRDMSNIEIEHVLNKEKELVHWTYLARSLIIVFKDSDEYYIILYNGYENDFFLGTVMIGKYKNKVQ